MRTESSKFTFRVQKRFARRLNAVRCVTVDPDGNVYAGDSATREVYVFDQDGKPIPLTNGSIGIAADLLIDGDDIIVSDLETERLWRFPKSGGKPEELIVMAAVRGLAKDKDGNLIAVTTLEDPVQRISDAGEQDTIISGRPFEMPHHCAIVGEEIYVADNYAATIWKASLNPEAKPEPYLQGAPLNKPVGLCRYKEGFLVADPHAKKIFQINQDGEISPLME